MTKEQPELRWAYDLAAMIQVSLVGYMVAGAFLSLAYFDLFYLLVAIVVATQDVVARALKGVPAETAEAAFRPGPPSHRPSVGRT